MRITEYNINTAKIKSGFSIACVSDLHGRSYERVIAALERIKVDAILLAGDILEVSNDFMRRRNEQAFAFLAEAVRLAPVYYCFGNHELYFSHSRRYEERVSDKRIFGENLERICSLGINIVNDSFEKFTTSGGEQILIGGLVCGRDMDPESESKTPNTDFLKLFDGQRLFKLLLCHYPHYYTPYLKDTELDLVLSGHAHGGQWRIFGQGIYSPHQGLFPKYTSGMHDGRLIISRGAVNNSRPIPRFFNPTEIMQINIEPKR